MQRVGHTVEAGVLLAIVEIQNLRHAPAGVLRHGDERLDDVLLAHALTFRQKDRVDENSIGRPVQERDQLGREGGAVGAGQQHVLMVNVAEHDAHGQAALSGALDARPVLVVPLLRVLVVDRHGAVVAVASDESQAELAD